MRQLKMEDDENIPTDTYFVNLTDWASAEAGSMIYTGNISSDTITIGGSNYSFSNSISPTINITGVGSGGSAWGTISTSDSIYSSAYAAGIGEEWVDRLPDLVTVKEMSSEYPGLEKAFENFKTVYNLCKQDWLGKKKDDY